MLSNLDLPAFCDGTIYIKFESTIRPWVSSGLWHTMAVSRIFSLCPSDLVIGKVLLKSTIKLVYYLN